MLRIVAADQAGNEGTFEANLIVDNTPPVIGPLADITANATAASGAVVTFTVTATDALSTSVSVQCTPASATRFPLGTTNVTCTATDRAGNTADGSFNVIVADTGAPTIDPASLPSPAPVEATSSAGAVVTFALPTASDNLDPNPTVSCSPASGSTFAIGATAVSCSATDNAGQTSAAVTFNVTVQDTIKPTFSNVPANIATEATSASGATVSYTLPTATDAVDGTVTVTCDPASDSVFPFGATTVACSAKDSHDNTSTASFTVAVSDSGAPTIDTASVTDLRPVEATSASGAVVTYALPTATDTVDPNPIVTCTPQSGATLDLGSHTISCTARDSAENVSAAATFDVTVQDTTGPVISNVPGDITETTTDPSGTVVDYIKPNAADTVDGNVDVTCSNNPGTLFPIGTTTVTCAAQDSSGNSATPVSFLVTVNPAP